MIGQRRMHNKCSIYYGTRHDNIRVTFCLSFKTSLRAKPLIWQMSSRSKIFLFVLIISGQAPMYHTSNYSTVGLACGSSPFNDIVSTRNKVQQSPRMLTLTCLTLSTRHQACASQTIKHYKSVNTGTVYSD